MKPQPDRTGGTVLMEVSDFRAVARRIVRNPHLDDGAKVFAIARLADELRNAHPWVRENLWAEVREFLGVPAPFDTPAPPLDNPSERKLRGMRARGFERCGECGRPVPSWEELRHWDWLRAKRAEELERRERAGAAGR